MLLPALDQIAKTPDAAARASLIRLVRDSLRSSLAGSDADRAQDGLNRLTLAELKACRLVRAGHSSREIAGLLNISPETVQTHRRTIRRKLGLRGHDTQRAVHLLRGGDTA